MRISTTTFLLACAVLFGSAFKAIAQPVYDVIDIKHACGGNPNGSFVVHVTSANEFIELHVFGPGGFTPFEPPRVNNPALPYDFLVENAPGRANGGNWSIVVFDKDDPNTNVTTKVFDFTVTQPPTIVDNTNCVTPNGSINVDLTGSSPAGPIQYQWLGPGGPYITQDITSLSGGNYFLTYGDGITSCTIPVAHVNDPAPPLFTINSADVDICEGETVTVNVVGTTDPAWTYSLMNGATVLDSEVGTGAALPPLTATALLPNTIPYTLRVRASAGSCSDHFNDAPDLTVTVGAKPVGTDIDVTHCSDEMVAVNLSSNPLPVPAATFDIAVNPNGLTQSAGTPSAGPGKAASEIADDVWINTGLVSVDVFYTVIPVSAAPASCPGDPFIVTVTVNPEPVGASSAVTRCSDTAVGVTLTTSAASVAAATYNIAINANGLTQIGGIVSAGTGKLANELVDDAWRNTGLNTVDVVYTIVPVSAAGCFGDPFTVTVSVDPGPVGSDAALTVCSDVAVGHTLTTNSGSVAAGTYTIGVNANGLTQTAGTSSAGAGKAANEIEDDAWRNTGLIPVVVDYTITPVSAALCNGTPFHILVTVNPEPVGSNSAVARCHEDVVGVNLATSGTSVAAASYTIAVNANGLTQSAGTDSNGPGKAANEIADDAWQNLSAAAVDVTYTITPVSGGTCSGDNFTVIVTINPEPVGTPQNVTVCNNALVNVTLGVAGGSAPAATYDIVVNANGLTFSGTTPSGGPGKLANELIDDRWINNGIGPVNVEYTVTPVAATLCDGDPFMVIVTIDPGPVGADIPVTRCSDELVNVTLATSVAAVPAATYDIVVNANGLVQSAGTPSAGAGQFANELMGDAWTNTGLVAVDVTYTITPVSASGCAGDPFDVTVTVNPEPVGAPQAVTRCSDEMVNLVVGVAPGSVAAATYTITVNPNGLVFSSGTPSAGTGKAANELSDDTWMNMGLTPVDVVYTILPESPAICSGDPFEVRVTVHPEPVGNNVAASRCHEEILGINLTTSLSSVAAVTFDIVVNPNGLLQTGGTNSAGVGKVANEIADDVWSNAGNVPVNVVYTITPMSNMNCAGDFFTVVVTINPEPVGVPQNVSVCSDALVNVTLGVTGGSVAADTYDITINANGLVFNGATPSGGTGKLANELEDDRWTNTGAASVDVEYTIIPVSNGPCPGNSFTVTVSVFPAGTAEAGANQFLCFDNGAYPLAGSSVGGAATGHTWSVISEPSPGHANISPLGAPLNPAGDEFLATIPGDYVLQLSTDAVPVCGPATDLVTITVMNKPAIALLPETACTNDPVGYEIVMTSPTIPPTTLLDWGLPVLSDGSTQGSDGDDVLLGPPGTIHINDALINNSAADITATYTVTATTGLCVGDPAAIVITIRPGPALQFGQTKTICSGDRVDYEILLDPLNTPAGTTFSWPEPVEAPGVGSEPGIPAGPVGTLHIIDRLFNSDPTPKTVRYRVIPTGSNGCSGPTREIHIIVNPGAVVEAGNAKSVCSNGTVQLTGSSIGGLATIGTWTIVGEPLGGGDGSFPFQDPSAPDQARFTATIAGDYTLRLTTDAGGACPAVSDDVVVTVRPAGDPSCTGGNGGCPASIVPTIVTHATCNNSDGEVFFDITPPTPSTGDVRITINRIVPATPPESRTNFASVDGFNFAALPAGLYEYSVEYGGTSCAVNETFTINRNGTVGTPEAADPIDPSCFGETGSALIYVPGQTGTTLEWSADGATWTPFLDSTRVSGLPSGSNLISIRRPGDACNGGLIVTLANPTEITAGLMPTDATCFNNDGSIAVSNLTGGTGPYMFELNGDPINLPASNVIAGLTADTYDFIITDSKGCSSTPNPVNVSFPGFVNFTAPVTTAPDCSGGTNGKVEFTITDPGSFQFAFTTDLVLEPTTYNPLGGSLVSVSNLENGEYAVWLKPMGTGAKCSTKVPVTISGVYAVSYSATTSDVVCFAEPTSIVLSNITGAPGLPYGFTLTNTGDNSVTTGTITPSQALSAFSITNITPGNYSILLTQNQSSIVASCTTPINGGAQPLVVNGPSAALDSLYVKRAISFPDLPSGSALVGVNPSGLEPYETRLELTTPLFGAQEFVSDWTEVTVNPQNLKFERSYPNLYAGVYTLGIRDAGGCVRTYTFILHVDVSLFVPNMFSPNGDGHNEVFYIRNLPADTKLLVTNRWGKEVYKSSAYSNDWNGGDTVDGLYFYTLTLGSQNYTGWVEIMRGQ